MDKIIVSMKLIIRATVDISDACTKAIQLAIQEDTIVEFEFNGTVMTFAKDDEINRKVHEYHARRMDRR
jgi:hypothetical protein